MGRLTRFERANAGATIQIKKNFVHLNGQLKNYNKKEQKHMENEKQIINIFYNKLDYLLGKNDIAAYNKLYDGLFYHITQCINTEKETNKFFDLCITFLTLLKESINEVLFNNEK